MMPARHQGLLRLFIACALPLLALQSAAAADWQRYSVLPLPPSSPGAMPSNGRPRSPHNRLTNKE
ncbi:hypothetical protein CQA70_21850, partial [Klebsiella pneumoniae]